MDWTVGLGTPNKTIINMPENGWHWLADYALLNQGGMNMNSLRPLLLLSGWLGGFGWRGRGWAAAWAVASDIVLQPAFQSLQNQIQTLSWQVQANSMTDQIVDGFSTINSNISDVNNNINWTTRDILNNIWTVNTALAAGNFTTLNSINGLGRDVASAQNQSALQNLNSFNQLNTTVLQWFNNQQFQTAQATNQIIAQGTANAQAMAECCCAIKEKIGTDWALTRALINDLNVHNLEQELADAKLANSQAVQTNQLENFMRRFIPTPVTWSSVIV